MAQIRPITSEALEAQIRNLLPSQAGFGEDLQATNVITPIIDLTAAAQGETTGQNLQTAIAFGSSTAFSIINATTTLMNSPGFWQITYSSHCGYGTGATVTNFNITDGLSSKTFWSHFASGVPSGTGSAALTGYLIVFLRAGDSVSGQSNGAYGALTGSYRQIADVNGNLVNPNGFTPQ